MELIKAIILGAIQGVSEFLPISSTGHLILTENFLGISQVKYGLAFDAALHLGTLVALGWYFRKDWGKIFLVIYQYIDILKKSRWKKDASTQKSAQKSEQKLTLLLLVGTVPGIVLGLLLEDYVETIFRSPELVAATLILFSFVLIYVEKVGQKTASMGKLNWFDSLTIGCAQSVALIPGVSRSGITLAAGMWRGLIGSKKILSLALQNDIFFGKN